MADNLNGDETKHQYSWNEGPCGLYLVKDLTADFDMKLFLTSAYDVHTMLDALRVYAESDMIGRHEVCYSADEADIILFVEDGQFDDYLYKQIQMHTLVKRYPEKVFMYNEVDKPWCVLPGLYCNMPQRFFQRSRQVAFPMLTVPNELVAQIYDANDTAQRKFLYSFVGAASHRCRKGVFALADRNPAILDTSDFNVWDCTAEERLAAERLYADIMAESLYVLCPRGIGTSSYRLFETMQAGRAPVIISDQWVEPPQVNWDFALRIRESDVSEIPEWLQSRASEARDRGEAARAAWEASYSPSRIFDTITESVVRLKNEQRENLSTEGQFLENTRKILIQHENRAVAAARRVRDRVSGMFAPVESQS